MSRKTHRHVLPEVRDALATELRATRAAHGGSLPTPLVEQFARQYDLSVRTVHRLAADPGAVPTQRSRFALTDDQVAAVSAGPNRKKVWEAEVAAGRCPVGYPQFIRACNAEDPAVFDGARRGLTAMASKQAYLLCESAARNDMWIIDHYEVPVFVHWPGYRNPVKPWQTTLIDDKHRTVMGAIWWPKAPTAEQTVAAVAAAVRGFTEPGGGAFVGGSPQILLMDQGAEMIGEVAAAAYLAMRIDPQPAPARAPWVKGKLETFHGNVLDPGYATFPGRTGGPVDSAGRQILTTPDSELLSREEFRTRAWALLAAYNVTHAHSALDGQSPLESWLADDAPVRRIDDAILRQYWLTADRTVSGKGVHMHARPYQAPQLTHEGGRVLQVRYVPDDETFVDVQLSDGRWERAVPHPLPPTMANELLARRAAQTRRVRTIHGKARQLSAEAHAAARSAPTPTPAAPGTVPPAAATPVAPTATPPAAAAADDAQSRQRPQRRSTNTRGGGPQSIPDAPPPPAAPTAPAPPARLRPRRHSRPDPDTTS
ncbi:MULTISPECIES: Mu transposase C-terminal domain-containing protein [unclassified Modestobacter]